MVNKSISISKFNVLKIAAICFLVLSSFLFSGCFVTPAAWVRLKMDSGYIWYSAYMYASGGSHIYYYESEEEYNKGKNGYSKMEVIFFPRILGAEDVEIDGETVRTTLVDVSRYSDMEFTITKDSEVYSASKHVYLNGEVLEPTNTYNSEYIVSYMFENISLIRGNPMGQRNNVVNVIEYK